MNIAIVTPVKDEMDNLPKIFSAISALNNRIHTWIIIENDSVDGSKEYLDSVDCPETVENLIVLHRDTANTGYELGFKYSRIINYGFDYIKNLPEYEQVDFVGILDCDCFPEPDYYDKLVEIFLSDDQIGIASGLLKVDGYVQRAAKDFPRGCCRLWRRATLDSAGYVIGMSADAISAIKAIQSGWKCAVVSDGYVHCREVGGRVGYDYYGESAYYRGETLLFTLLKCASLFVADPVKSIGYARGYFSSLLTKKERISDSDVLEYSRGKIIRKLKSFF